MSPRSGVAATLRFLARRLPVEKMNVESLVTAKEVPVHRMSWAYYLGGLALFFFGIQLVTGLMMLFYYEPTVSDAHASVEYLTHHVAAGALIRNLHTWAASAMILTLLGLATTGVFTSVGGLTRQGLFHVISAHTGTGFGTVSSIELASWGGLAFGGIAIAMALGGASFSSRLYWGVLATIFGVLASVMTIRMRTVALRNEEYVSEVAP